MDPTAWTHGDYIALANAIASLAVGVAIVIATFRGPIVATERADARRIQTEELGRQMEVFRRMMAHRHDVTDPNFVLGLNAVSVEFSKCEPVMKSFRAFLFSYRNRSNEPDQNLVFQDRKSAVARLLSTVGAELGYNLEHLDVLEELYAPQGWQTRADKQNAVLDLLSDIAQGKRAFPVMTFVPDNFVHQRGGQQLAFRIAIEPSPPPPA